MLGHWSRAATAFIAVGTRRLRQANERCAPSAFNASSPLRWQTASDGAPVQSIIEQCARAMRRIVLIIPSARSFPCTPKIHRSRVTGHKEIAPAANICSPKCYILYVPRPTYRGSVPLCMPPFSYKRGGMRRYKTHPISSSQVHTSSQAIHHTME